MFYFKVDLQFNNFKRQHSIRNGYRPLIFFTDGITRSAEVVIEENQEFLMDKAYRDCLIGIFIYQDLKLTEDFWLGKMFTVREGGSVIIGVGIITEVVGIADENTAP